LPAQEVAFIPDTLVYWPFLRWDRYRNPIVDSPVELPCRWNNTRRVVVDGKGNTIAIDAEIILDQDILVHSLVWRGKLIDWLSSGSGAAQVDTSLMIVKMYEPTEDLKGREVFHNAMLMRYKHTQQAPGA
jgi:hypothetical protein